MEKFTEAELIGRNKFLTILALSNIIDYEFTEDPYDWVDCYYSKNNKRTEVEIKVRSLVYSTLYMEVTKFKEMRLLIKEGNADKGLYINFIGDKCYIFRLEDIKKSTGCYLSTEYVKRTTAVYSGKLNKRMINLPIKLARVFEFKNDKWKRI